MRSLRCSSLPWPRPSMASQVARAPPRDALFAANAAVGEAQVLEQLRVVDVAAVDDDRTAHDLFDAAKVELAELVPFGDDDERVCAVRNLVGVFQVLDVGDQHPRPLDGSG